MDLRAGWFWRGPLTELGPDGFLPSDPDELTYNLFVSANAKSGYDFVGYVNPDYDKIAQDCAQLLDRLNYDADSPLREMIRTPTTTRGVIKDNSLLKMLENSLSDGVLYRFRDPESGQGDEEQILAVLKAYWGAAASVFKSAWGLSPHRS